MSKRTRISLSEYDPDDEDIYGEEDENAEAYAALEQLQTATTSHKTTGVSGAQKSISEQPSSLSQEKEQKQQQDKERSPKPKRFKNIESTFGIYRDRIPPGSIDCISVKSSMTDDHVFVTLVPSGGDDDNDGCWMANQLESKLREQTGSMLGVSIEEMMDNAERNLLTMTNKKSLLADREMTATRVTSDDHTHTKSMLYVDKYSPKAFTDLLTNEQFNREVLKWVKEWDPIVFPDRQTTTTTTAATTKQYLSRDKSGKPMLGPENRILLISGPPGIGKTTLAHVVAKHAGYRPVEINASDDRSSDRLMELITNYTQTQSMFGDKRPILLIIDEIDGLHNSETRSAITALLKLAYPKKAANPSTESGDKTKDDKKKKKKKKTQRQLNRPIICICNDHYAPVLRELRLKSKLFVFRRKETQDMHNIERMTNRISHICSQEQLSFSKRYIRDLAVKSDGDIRTCLNTIQFASSDKLENMDLAQKDSRKDFFDLMTKIFDKKSDVSSLDKTEHRLSQISQILSDELDRYDTLLMGCFENYPFVKYSSSINLRETVRTLEWSSWSDKMNLVMRRNNAFALSSYTLFSIAMYHLNCMSLYKQGFHKYVYPKKDGDAFRECEQRRNICRSMFSMETKVSKDNTIATTSCTMFDHHPIRSSTDLQLDTLPQLVSMLYPSTLIKTKSTHTNNLMYGTDTNTSLVTNIKNVAERQAVQNIISLCVDYGLSFRSSYENGSLKYELEPPIHKLVDFSLNTEDQDKKKAPANETRLDLPYTIKRIISAEIHNEKLNRVAKKKGNSKAKTGDKSVAPTSPITPPKMKSAFTTSPTSSPSVQTSNISIYFSYHDGHTNAIRRPAKLKAFL